jgi:Domain of unknown function (DUF4382)
MQRIMLRRAIYSAVIAALSASLAACGGGGSSGNSSSSGSSTSSSQATMPLMVSDAASDDWACIGVRILSVALIPQSGGSAVTVWTAPSPAPYENLVQLDNLSDVIGNVSVPTGTYTGAVLTLSANPGDVILTANNNPESGFPLAAGASVPTSQLQIQGASGSSGSLTVPVTVNFVNALTIAANTTNVALNLEFDLAHPTFIVDHTPPAADGGSVWVVNFNGPIRHRPVHDITALVLRHTYGTVTQVTSAAMTIDKDYPVYPVTNPETQITSSTALTIDADSVNGTIVYDLDADSRTVVTGFGSSNLNGRFVRVASRYQEDGSLIAVRVWVSSNFDKVWVSPEGHVLNVNAQTGIITVTNENGVPVQVSVGSDTEFYFRAPANAEADATPIGQGLSFLTNQEIVRGFKVHVGSMNPLAVPLPASSVDIETAAFGGHISNASTTGGFTYTSDYRAVADNYSVPLSYIAATTDNGFNNQGMQIQGFDWWYFTFPTQADSSISDFVAATNGALAPGGSLGALQAWGESIARWGDGSGNSTTATGWYARDAILEPTPTPLGTVATPLGGGTVFSVNLLGAASAIPVSLSTTAGQATLVYQINRSGGKVTITPVDISGGGTGLATLSAALTTGAIVKVWGVPLAGPTPGSGTLAAYVLAYYSGTPPGM